MVSVLPVSTVLILFTPTKKKKKKTSDFPTVAQLSIPQGTKISVKVRSVAMISANACRDLPAG